MHRTCCVCNQDNAQYWYKPSQSPGPVVQCKNCGFVYVSPIETTKALIQEGPVLGDRPASLLTSSDIREIEGSWEQPLIEGYIKELSAKQANAREALSHLTQVKPNRGKLLDVGCFCGVFLGVAAHAGWDAYGIEPLVMPSIYARNCFGLNVTTDTLRDDSFSPDFFDVVTAFQVFEHLIDPAAEIAKIRRILKPGGLVMIEVPNIDTLLVKIMRSKHRHFVQDHVSLFSAKTLGRLLEREGFKVVSVYYPVRVLSMYHLAWWTHRFIGETLSDRLANLVERSGLGSRTVNIGLGDIVSVIAAKQ